MKENALDGFKAISSIMRNFGIWPKKSLWGDHRTKGGTVGKKFFEACFFELKMIVLMKENVFDGFKACFYQFKIIVLILFLKEFEIFKNGREKG